MPNSIRLTNRVAIVSGSGRGIGAGIAKVLAANGAKVVLAEIDEACGNQIACEIGNGGGEAHFSACDVSDAGSIKSMLAEAINRFGKLDILVNNVGQTLIVPIDSMSQDSWDQLQSVNLRSMFLMTQACLPYLRESQNAAIVNMSSVNAAVTLGGLSAYAATKAGIVGFTKSLAAELAPGIRVNAIAPGVILTDAWQQYQALDQVLAHRLQYIPLERVGTPADIGEGVAFLVSDMASFITGAVLTIDGGMTSRLYDGRLP